MRLSAIIPIFGFDPNRETALKMMIQSCIEQDLFEYDANSQPTGNKNYEVIIVEQNETREPRRRNYLEALPPYIKHIRLDYQEKGFNKAWCMNVGAREAKCNTLVYLDADTLFDKNFFERIAKFSESKRLDFFLCWQYIMGMPGKDAPLPRLIETTLLTAGGAFCVQKEFFWSIGGMCENYFGYGGEDNDFWCRANHKLGKTSENNIQNMPYALLHWYHDWAKPSDERYYFLNRTVEHTEEVMSRLRTKKLGNIRQPTLIDFSGLDLANAGIEKSYSKGIVR